MRIVALPTIVKRDRKLSKEWILCLESLGKAAKTDQWSGSD